MCWAMPNAKLSRKWWYETSLTLVRCSGFFFWCDENLTKFQNYLSSVLSLTWELYEWTPTGYVTIRTCYHCDLTTNGIWRWMPRKSFLPLKIVDNKVILMDGQEVANTNKDNDEEQPAVAFPGDEQSSSVAVVLTKLPPFCPNYTQAWFTQLKAQLNTPNMTPEVTRYKHIGGSLARQ